MSTGEDEDEEDRLQGLIDIGKLEKWMDERDLPGAGEPLAARFISGGAYRLHAPYFTISFFFKIFAECTATAPNVQYPVTWIGDEWQNFGPGILVIRISFCVFAHLGYLDIARMTDFRHLREIHSDPGSVRPSLAL